MAKTRAKKPLSCSTVVARTEINKDGITIPNPIDGKNYEIIGSTSILQSLTKMSITSIFFLNNLDWGVDSTKKEIMENKDRTKYNTEILNKLKKKK